MTAIEQYFHVKTLILVPRSCATYRQWWTLLYQVPHNLQVPVGPLGNLIINIERSCINNKKGRKEASPLSRLRLSDGIGMTVSADRVFCTIWRSLTSGKNKTLDLILARHVPSFARAFCWSEQNPCHFPYSQSPQTRCFCQPVLSNSDSPRFSRAFRCCTFLSGVLVSSLGYLRLLWLVKCTFFESC